MDNLRTRIDDIDRRLIDILNERANVSVEIGRLKSAQDSSVYVPSREKLVYDKVKRLNDERNGLLPTAAVQAIYREIMSASIALQRPLAIAYLGPPATNTHEAARAKFGASVAYVECETIHDVFEAVLHGRAGYGVVPIENSTEGSVAHTLDELAASSGRLKVYAEVFMPIDHYLVSRTKTLAGVRRVYSHPQALAQCRWWLNSSVRQAELVPVSSTAKAAEMAAREGEGAAALSSLLASELYDIPILASRVQDAADNTTRFIVVGSNCEAPTGDDRTFLFFSLQDRPGALCDALSALKSAGVSLTKIESRPSRARAWDYNFFCGHCGARGGPCDPRGRRGHGRSLHLCDSAGIVPKRTKRPATARACARRSGRRRA
eukprot:Opistho-1_new@63011